MSQATLPTPTRRSRRGMTERTREALTAYSFLAPFLIFLIIFFVYAFIRTVFFSFTDYNLFNNNVAQHLGPITVTTPPLVGVSQYQTIFNQPLFRTALANTLIYSITVTVLQTFGALLLAIALNQRIQGLGYFRTAYYLPSITSSVAITLIFIWLFNAHGTISYISGFLSNHSGPILAFLGALVVAQVLQVLWERSRRLPAGWFDPVLLITSSLVALLAAFLLYAFGVVTVGTAETPLMNWLSTRDKLFGFIPYPLLFIIVQNTFTTIPTLMLFFLAGLQGVSKSLYEASEMDGANAMQKFRFITVPTLRPVTFYVVTVSIIGTLQLFDQVSLTSAVSPLESNITLAYYVFNNVFSSAGFAKVGTASAAAIILAALTMLIVVIQRRFIVSDKGVS